MLPRTAEYGERLAAIMPGAMQMLAPEMFSDIPGELPTKRCIVVLIVDGLGVHNLEPVKGHARTLWKLLAGSLETVVPSTTGAALSSITTGALPGQHGLLGYRIRHPQLGMRTTLSEWKGIDDVREWQLQPTLFERGSTCGVQSFAVGRPSHRDGGLTRAVLTGATYVAGQTIEDRVTQTMRIVREAVSPTLVYLYVDELDRAGHRSGVQSDIWLRRLEQADASVARLVSSLPDDTLLLGSADHGMVDIPSVRHVMFTAGSGAFEGVALVGGEPRLRYLYLQKHDPEKPSPEKHSHVEAVKGRLQDHLGEEAWVYTREDAMNAGFYGAVDPSVSDRLGDIMVAARANIALYEQNADANSLAMVGQHGSFTKEEREVPLFIHGELDRAAFNAWLQAYGRTLTPKRRKPRRK